MDYSNLETGHQIGDYTVLATLGHGGMSDVYLARDAVRDREVTLKFPHDSMLGDPASYERFAREIKIGQLLEHPNIQKLYEVAGNATSPYLVLEYIEGQTLRSWVAKARPDWERARDLGIQIGDALAYAHQMGVFHRDLKPENILISPSGTAKVMDFGIAFVEGARRITWGKLSSQVGTPDYMAPEQIKGARGDARTDIYALGMIMYEIAAGRLPYEGDNSLSIMSQHVTVSPPPLTQWVPEVPPELSETIMKAIRRNPGDRWASMQTLVEALRSPEKMDVKTLRHEREREENAPSGPEVPPTVHGTSPLQTALIVVLSLVAVGLVGILAQVLHRGH